ncbi:primosomal protein N' [Cellulomonas gelida]|uniref:Probable replication restart protein PriA n=1 Tax=Cellulomonas gelida TaxID=1712 RepID=A0A4Y3KG76_9CELL|nr:primosomal protein N' [Cellulomonas gelida]GEA82863.1 putative primosomal protein N' [Cellulomonas gelida]GGL34608.1 putative primosomal protein N' [Cellulomonas gelida]
METTPEQLTLDGVPAPRARRRPRAAGDLATELPVARVCIDLPPAHLDRPFEYAVPAALSDDAQAGTRVKVRFGGQDVDGYVLERADEAEHDGALVPLRRVVSAEVVLHPATARLARAVADRWAGTLADVLRLAIPPRHARVEAESSPDEPTDVPPPSPSATAWTDYRGGSAFVQHVTGGGAPRAVWTALPGGPGARWPDAIAQAVAAAVLGGRGALVVVPDARDVDRVLAALEDAGVPRWAPGLRGGAVRLTADDGPSPRYRAFLAASRGQADVVVGTRAAAFAPVHDLGLVVCWDDGDSLHAEPRAPYPHVREVLALRSEIEHAALLVGAHGRTVEAQALVAAGWAHDVSADRARVRARTPRVRALTSTELAREGAAAAARLPTPAWRAIRDRLADGPVLVQVPRAGYLPAVACGRCRSAARCSACHGPLALHASDGVPTCSWCGRMATDWRCDECGAAALRSVRVGSERTAEELGRAFPGVPVVVSGARAATGVVASVKDRPALVVATPGAEPVAPAGYAAAVLLDAAVATAGSALGVLTDAVRRWLAAAALVRAADDGGVVLLVGDAEQRASQAIVRWDPVGLAVRELDERAALGLPPAYRMASVTGTRDAVAAVLRRVALPGLDVLGPVPVPGSERGAFEPDVRALLRVPRSSGGALASAVAASVAVRSAKREGGTARVQLDPGELL